ncbi:MAG: transposase [Phycisphaerae bacterium]|jgi:REP element-mobilizing transposase RayT
MHKTLGYLLTWTTYGTWLQGNKKGYVKNGVIFKPNTPLANTNKQKLKKDPVVLTPVQREIIETAIRIRAGEIGQKIYAVAVCSDHIHLVVDYTTKDLGLIVRHYKTASLKAMRDKGFTGPLWTKGFDKRYCFDEKTLRSRISYVNKH